MLKLISRFVLEVLPYMLSALIAAIVVPGFLMSQLQLHGNQLAGASNSADGTIRALELVHSDHAPFASRQTLSRRCSSAVDQLVAK
jgi:hypothetical protein